MGPTTPKSNHDWQAEDDCRTLMRAEEIKMDKGRHNRAKRHAMKQAKASVRVAGKDAATLMKGHQ